VPGAFKLDLSQVLADETNVVWVDLRGETDEERKKAKNILLNTFHFHYLTVEDCLETRNAPKIEAFTDYFYFIVHGVRPGETSPANFATKELDGYLGKNFVVTFHIERFRSIKLVKQQVRSSTFACTRGAAYLLHQILDQLVDYYMPLVDEFDVEINSLEERVLTMKRGTNAILEEIMDLRRSVARIKRISSRQLEVLYRMSHGEFPQIPTNTLPFLSQSGAQAIWQGTTSWTNPDTGTLHTGVPIRMRINLSGGIATWVTQARWRRSARRRGAEAQRWQAEADRLGRERQAAVAADRQLAAANR